ncbi:MULTISPECIES: hypothetical protein [unclassified Gilliamella]|uniref:hypothetical protein n=1 Tax=unclassified Gilliamella TaxID=2685620 RepID=UPI00226A3401|nr:MULTISPECIES: hypothetical protein [unclassified Gilliamella]MCX8587061.1 hypothetical protein [Gilliamella sp. B3801]MCX8592279.1 hypothetical protein [Gilliamella sp. B3804]
MKKIIRLLAFSAFVSLLVGCHLLDSKKTVDTPPIDNSPIGIIETPPQIVKKTDWRSILSPFITKILQSSSIPEGNRVLLISDIQNRTGEFVANNQIDEALHQLMSKQPIFSVVNKQSINQAKQAIGIGSDDKFVSRGKMIGLAKSINAQYVLFTTLYQLPNDDNGTDADLSIELLSTQNGEILERVASKDFAQPKTQTDNNQTEANE